jgi:hypothetical protein
MSSTLSAPKMSASLLMKGARSALRLRLLATVRRRDVMKAVARRRGRQPAELGRLVARRGSQRGDGAVQIVLALHDVPASSLVLMAQIDAEVRGLVQRPRSARPPRRPAGPPLATRSRDRSGRRTCARRHSGGGLSRSGVSKRVSVAIGAVPCAARTVPDTLSGVTFLD